MEQPTDQNAEKSLPSHAEPETLPSRDDSGRFLPGHPGTLAGLRHGLKSARLMNLELPEQADARAALAERVAAIVTDLGGIDGLSSVAVGLVERHARLELVADYLFERLETLGPLTAKGRTRAALSGYLAVVDRLHRSAQLLGLERRAKPVNPLDAVRSAVEAANRGSHAAP